MKIKQIKIHNFKSIKNIQIEEPNRFSVFVGANASGKSNIFESFELAYLITQIGASELSNMFPDPDDVLNRNIKQKIFKFKIADLRGNYTLENLSYNQDNKNDIKIITTSSSKDEHVFQEPQDEQNKYSGIDHTRHFRQFYTNFSRIFIGKSEYVKLDQKSSKKLSLDASNLEKVLKRILSEKAIHREFLDWLGLLITDFKNIEVSKSAFSGEESLLLYDKHYNKPFTKNLISDGTYNILSLLTAVLQSDKPQFLLIEEPENGLNPKAVKEMVHFFREQCEEKGHYIWLASHSQTLVSELKPEELIVVDKVDGETRIKQFKNINLHGMKLDDAWLSNVLGGGLPW